MCWTLACLNAVKMRSTELEGSTKEVIENTKSRHVLKWACFSFKLDAWQQMLHFKVRPPHRNFKVDGRELMESFLKASPTSRLPKVREVEVQEGFWEFLKRPICISKFPTVTTAHFAKGLKFKNFITRDSEKGTEKANIHSGWKMTCQLGIESKLLAWRAYIRNINKSHT